MTKVRNELLHVAREVERRFPGEEGTLVQTQIDAAIGLQAKEKFLSEEDYARLIQLRSQVFKSPRKKLTLEAASGSRPKDKV